MTTATADAASSLLEKFPDATRRASLDHPAVNVPLAEVHAAVAYLQGECAFDFLVDITAVDWSMGADPRFTVLYHLFSTTTHDYIRVATTPGVESETYTVPSITDLWPGANWHEREVFDMFGIKFSGHPDLRRILMWEAYPHFPLRKEFPLSGIDTPLPDLEVATETGTNLIAAPMKGGPFVAGTGEINLSEAEPSAKDQSWNERKVKPE